MYSTSQLVLIIFSTELKPLFCLDLYNVHVLLWSAGMARGESTCLPPMWPGFDSQTRRHMRFEFVGSLLSAPRGFSLGTLVFPSPQKPTFDLICVNC